MSAPWPLLPLGTPIDQVRYIVYEFEGAKHGHRVVNNPRDPGGRTLSGLTLLTYSREYLRLPAPALAPIEQFDALALDDVVAVIVELFAMRPGIWRIQDAALRLAVLDFAIHAGAYDDAIPALQRALRVEADGRIGRETIGALEHHTNTRALFASVLDQRYQKAGRRMVERPDQLGFLTGWLDRVGRILRIGAVGLLLLTLVGVYLADAQDGGERANGGLRDSLGRGVPVELPTSGPRTLPATAFPILPDSRLTPGVTQPITMAQMCRTPHYADTIRRVTPAMRREVFQRYGLPVSGAFEVDHLVPLVMGGSNALENLWPQAYGTTPWNARVKDALENTLRRRVCWGGLALAEAQEAIRTNWIGAYRRYIKPLTQPAGTAGTSGVAQVVIDVLPRVAMAPAAVRIRVTVERDADNRLLGVNVEGPAYARYFEEQLDGLAAARTRQRIYDGLPSGTYVITACVRRVSGRIVCARPDAFEAVGTP